MKDYRKLDAWKRAHAFTLSIYRLTKQFPTEEKFGLISQLRRSSSSVAANLAEGCGRNSDAELARFSEIAHGSASESEYHLLLARDLEFISPSVHEGLHDEISQIKRMLGGLIRRLRKPTSENPKADS